MEDPYESTNQQGRLRARIAEYTKPPSDTKVIGNTIYIVLCILIIKTTTFMYEIKHLDPLTEILLLTTSSNTIFSYIARKMKRTTVHSAQHLTMVSDFDSSMVNIYL
jgi:hypothetical protein